MPDEMNAFRDRPWRKWGLGVVVPSLISAWALSIFISGEAVLRRRRGPRLELTGLDASLIALAILSVALIMHSHFFWRDSERLASYSDYLEVLAGIAFIGSLCAVIVRVLIFR